MAILVGAALSAVLATINGLQLQSLERALGGLEAPEAQLGGYDAGYIELVRSRMTDELLERYDASHYLWDMLFPLVFAATIMLLIAYICAGRKRRWLLMLAPVLFAVVDIAENLTLESLMGGAGTDAGIDASVVMFAAALTIGKAVVRLEPGRSSPCAAHPTPTQGPLVMTSSTPVVQAYPGKDFRVSTAPYSDVHFFRDSEVGASGGLGGV